MISGTFNLALYENVVQAESLRCEGELISYKADMKIWENNASGTSKHTRNNAYKMVATLMELLSDDLKVKVKNDGRFPSLEAGGDIKRSIQPRGRKGLRSG